MVHVQLGLFSQLLAYAAFGLFFQGTYALEKPWKACPNYKVFSEKRHFPAEGSLKLPLQRPVHACRTFHSDVVENKILEVKDALGDTDLARLFENCFPNTLDTTIRWHSPEKDDPQTLVITGDIPAEWLRDSAHQLAPYHALAPKDKQLAMLLLGAIQTQSEMIIQFPYCNAFQPPKKSYIHGEDNGQSDVVTPSYDPLVVFECKYELDSLASFLRLSYKYWKATSDNRIFTTKWLAAVEVIYTVLEQQSISTFNEETGLPRNPVYSFRRRTDAGTETLALSGRGFPVQGNGTLIRSAFRPSDDACTLQYLIPSNAMMAVELGHLQEMLSANGKHSLAQAAQSWTKKIREGIEKYGIVEHPVFGRVYAYEVDAYGSAIFMDDANIPSLLSLPYLGFVERDDSVYLNTRKMVLSPQGNPFFLKGRLIQGIGGPHVGLRNVWPMSLMIQAITSDNDTEISELLNIIKRSTNGLGLMHETVDVSNFSLYTRPWFSWANSLFSELIMDLLERKPHLVKKKSA
ncbi:hypothetical protein SJAG_01883 [Schizosaccharomyces japonicus yFS275]|uniref:Uncharacterized protein n=1 Tax=Schizosaccharomyces japonicus (strain yFS275 / FY16936) TaxID=402676 RepID=B6JZ59_SCHJY|nr:hypothetical protein SJAG_01883 [Schizosaccharomyces japonicus yFS275]EEB06827.1 hypothetical protein SJAG_01883 [Schizosaccharomyces japonicus yFS275]